MRLADLHAEVEVAEWNLSNLQTIVKSGSNRGQLRLLIPTPPSTNTTTNKNFYIPPLVCMPIEPNTKTNSLTIIDPNDLTRETAEATSC